MKIRLIIWRTTLLAVSIAAFNLVAVGTASCKSAKEITITFPDESIGFLKNVVYSNTQKPYYEQFGNAQGKVRVPEDAVLKLFLNQHGCHIPSLSCIPKWPAGKIYSISAANVEQFKDEQLEAYCQTKGLERIFLANTEVTDAGLKYLKNVENLKEIQLSDTNVSSRGLASLSALTTLEILNLSMTDLKDADLHEIKSLKKLNYLSVANSNIDGKALKSVVELQNLYDLNISGNHKIKDSDLPQLAKLNKLAIFNIKRTSVTEKCIPSLKAFKHLKEIAVSFSPAGWKQLQQTLPGVRIVGERSRVPMQLFEPLK